MVWSKEQIKDHVITARLHDKIMNETFDYIRDNKANITEYGVQQFVMRRFEHYDLRIDMYRPIVAFGSNSDKTHAIPSKISRKLRKNSVIMIDIWARMNKKRAPFADMTWMGYYGKPPKKVAEVFDVVIKARNRCITFIKSKLKNKELPIGKDCDDIVKKVIADEGYRGLMIHSTGHSLGTVSVSGLFAGLSQRNKKRLTHNIGYSLEPGIYIKGKFGMRSEMDFYISKDNKMIITTKLQKSLVRI